MEELGIYIHIPFCKQKCFYCDFCSFANKNEMQGKYVETVINEIKNITHKEKYTVTTIYLGGGTPSILNPDYIKSILQEIKSSFEILDDAEITIEINPGTVNEEKRSVEVIMPINAQRIDFEIKSVEKKFIDIKIVASSLRLDNIIADLAKTSRSKAIDILEQERVWVNYEVESKATKLIKEKDIITIRGKGKFIVDEIAGSTKKGNYVIWLKKFA